MALKKYISDVPNEMKGYLKEEKIDKEYAKFFCKCYSLKNQIETIYKIKLTNRQLDNLLIETANNLII